MTYLLYGEKTIVEVTEVWRAGDTSRVRHTELDFQHQPTGRRWFTIECAEPCPVRVPLMESLDLGQRIPLRQAQQEG